MKDFLNFNQHCPICKEPLTLYMQWTGSQIDYVKKLFVSSRLDNKVIMFEEHAVFKNKSNSGFGTDYGDKKKKLPEIVMLLKEEGNNYIASFNTLSTAKMAKEQDSVYFYYLCNPRAINDLGYDHQIDIYYGCYYRSTPLIQLSEDKSKPQQLLVKYIQDNEIINKDEYYVVKNKIGDLEKVYLIVLDNEEKKTIFHHYAVTDAEAAQENFEPKLLEREMPLLNTRINFEDREKLINRLESWIIFS